VFTKRVTFHLCSIAMSLCFTACVTNACPCKSFSSQNSLPPRITLCHMPCYFPFTLNPTCKRCPGGQCQEQPLCKCLCLLKDSVFPEVLIFRNWIIESKPGVLVHSCNPSYVGGIGRSSIVWGWPWVKTEKYLKIKRAEGVSQVVEPWVQTRKKARPGTSLDWRGR
jgi:hypothetical protein